MEKAKAQAAMEDDNARRYPLYVSDFGSHLDTRDDSQRFIPRRSMGHLCGIGTRHVASQLVAPNFILTSALT